MATDHNSTELLREEILADAKREGEGIIAHAKEDAETILNEAATEADRIMQELLDQARAEADRQSALILATVPVETGRLRAASVERLLESIYKDAGRRLLACEGFDHNEAVIALASYAVNQMEGPGFIIRLTDSVHFERDNALAEKIADRVGRPVTIEVVFDKGVSGTGVMVEDDKGRQVWDNRLLKRLERLWPELRRQIALEADFVPKRTKTGEAK